MIKARGEVVQKMEGMQNVSKEKYHEIVDTVMKGYKRHEECQPGGIGCRSRGSRPTGALSRRASEKLRRRALLKSPQRKLRRKRNKNTKAPYFWT